MDASAQGAAPRNLSPAMPVARRSSGPPPLPQTPPVPPVQAEAPRAERAAPAPGHLKTRIGFGSPGEAAAGALLAGAPVSDEQRKKQASEFIAICEAELGRRPDAARAGRLHYEMARLFETVLADRAAASTHYHRAHALCPEHLPTLHGTRRALIEQKNYPSALPLFDAEARLTSDPRRKALLFYEKGRILEDQLGQRREAHDAYVTALELNKLDATLLKAVERTELSADAWTDLEQTYEREANAVASDPRHRAAIIAERAHIVETKNGDAAQATELYETALALDARAPLALHALKRLHYDQKRWTDLIAVLEREVEQVSDPVARSMGLYRIGRILTDRLGKLDEGTTALERAAAQAPSDRMVLEELARLYELSKRYEALVLVLDRLVEQVESPAEKLGYIHRIGQLFEERLGNEDKAIEYHSRALALDATYVPSLQALAKLHTRRKQWESLVAMHLAEALATQEPSRRAAAHARVAEILEVQLGSRDQAAQHHARALGLVALYPPSFKALTRIYAQSGKSRELIELYERAVEGSRDNETKITYLFKIGRIFEDALNEPGQALSAYRRILELEARHLGAIHALQRAAERGGRWKELVSALELEATVISDRTQAVALLHRAGEVYETELGDDSAALAAYRRVIDIEPGYLPALASLGRLFYRAGRWEDLLDTYRRELRATPRGSAQAALLYKMGELCEERIGKDEDAIAAYRAAIEADPFHTPALHALQRKLSERGEWQKLVKLLELELSGLKDEELRAKTAFRIGEVYENLLLSPDKALAAYDQALIAQADFRPVLDARTRLLSQSRDWKRLAEGLAREVAAAKDPMIAVTALLREGEIHRDELGDTQRAIKCFEAVLERDPAHLGALLALEPLYASIGNWEALGRVHATEARVFGDVGARVAALRELARLQENKGLGGPEQLKQTYFSILQLVPTDVATLLSLERMALAASDKQLLSHVDAKLGAVIEEPALAAAHHTRLAETLESMGDPSALDVYRAALGRDPENLAATRGLARLAERQQNPDLLEDAAEREARVTGDRESAARLFMQAAMLRTQRGDIENAVKGLERALELNPDHDNVAGRLRELLLARGDVDRLLSALTSAAQRATRRDRMAMLWVNVAELLADKKNDVPAGLVALNRVYQDAPGHVPMLMKLAELYARDGQWAESVDRLQRAIAEKPETDVLVEAHLRLAVILDEHLGDQARALSSLNAVLKLNESNRSALKRLLDIQMRRGQNEAAADTAARLVRVSTDRESRSDSLSTLARLEKGRGNYPAAAQAYEQAIALVGLEFGLADEFKQMLNQQRLTSEYNRYVAALGRYLEQARPAPALAANVQLEIARALGDQLGQAEQSLAALQRGIAAQPDDVSLRSELASRMRRAGHFPQAAQEYRRLLEVDVMRADAWRDLVECFKGMQKPAEAALALAPLVAIGAANDLERATLGARPPRTAAAHPAAFDASAFRSIDALGGPDPAADLLVTLNEVLGKLQPPELERYGLTLRDRISARTPHPLRMLSDRIAAIFGIVEHDLYLHRAHSGALEIEFTDPPAILVPSYLTNLSEAQQTFLLARVMANLARGLQAADKLAPPALETLLASAARNIDASYGMGIGDEEFLSNQAKRIVKALSRRGRRSMEEAALLYVGVPRINFMDWVAKVRLTAARAALILSDDLPASIELIRRMEGDLAGLSGVALAQGMRVVQDLLRFWVSDSAFALRRRLGML